MTLRHGAHRSIVVAGALTQKPGRGGHTWVFLQYLLGFKQLGWDVLFLDRLDQHSSIDERGAPVPIADSWNVRYLRGVMANAGLADSYALLCGDGSTVGLARREVIERVRRASALLNVMGFLDDEEVLAAAPLRVFLDIDPGFPQMWQALGLHDPFSGHESYVTIGENIGRADCIVPTCGLSWITTPQPVVLDRWPAIDACGGRARPMTTVASWRGAYGSIDFEGTSYGLRAREFRKFAPLPARTGRPFEIALDIHAADERDCELLRRQGWTIVNPREVAGDPAQYRDFIARSAAEVMVAKGMYVQAQSGWFSDRSICYLASGKPVVAQDTGLSRLLPVGEGLLTYATLEEAVDATRAVDGDYARHARAARRLAETRFDSSIVLGRLARMLGIA